MDKQFSTQFRDRYPVRAFAPGCGVTITAEHKEGSLYIIVITITFHRAERAIVSIPLDPYLNAGDLPLTDTDFNGIETYIASLFTNASIVFGLGSDDGFAVTVTTVINPQRQTRFAATANIPRTDADKFLTGID